LIGVGMVSDQYLAGLARYPDVKVVAIGGRNVARAAAQAARYHVPAAGGVASVLAYEGVEIVVNLTSPAAHVEVSAAALEAGKHVWSEKPIGLERASAKALVALADERGLLLGVAPDTLLGPHWQTAKRAVQAGVIGTPLSATTVFQGQGPDWFHPSPEFLFAKGGGPLFDNGPYHLSALVDLLGPIAEVVAMGTRAQPGRSVRVGPRAGTEFPVKVPTHLAVTAAFEGGATASSVMSFDTPKFTLGAFEVNGTEGTIVLGAPNLYSGMPIRVYRRWTESPATFEQEFETIPEQGPLSTRGVGVLAMARALRGHDLHVATGRVAYHVLDAMVAIEESAERREFVKVISTAGPIPALPPDFDPFAPHAE
jgi:predicted dehydrogenase